MIIIRNNIIPFKGYKCINIFGILFARKNAILDEYTINHEKIHTKQIIENFIIGFYTLYGTFYIINIIKYKNHKEAYRNIPFECEAYENEKDLSYLSKRTAYAWINYIN